MMRLYLKTMLILVGLTISFSTTTYAQITADFTVSLTEICEGIFVGATATITNSPNAIDTIKWDFGETGFEVGTTGSGYIYNDEGLFTVRLVVIDVMGNTDTTTKVDLIKVNPKPVIDFTVSNNLGCVPFNSTLSFSTSNVVVPGWTWTWVISSDSTCLDGPVSDTLIYSNGNPFNYTFTQAGIYDIELIVENQLDCESQTVKNNIVVANASPTAGFSFVANSNCMGATDVAFTSTSTLTCTNNPFYIWDFGDGPTMTTTDLNISHQYTIEGLYPVQLIINDGANNCADTIIQNITITAQDTVAFNYTPQGGCEGTTIQFNESSSGNPIGWDWDFGDGNNSTLQNPSHTYDVSGCYFVTLTVDYGGCSITEVTPTCITIDPVPTVSYNIIGSTLSCVAPLTVSFAPVITNASPPILTWYFGNGDSSSVLTPSYTYTESGIYPITLKVVNSFGCETIVSTDTIIVDAIQVGFQADLTSGCAPLAITFIDTSFSLSPIISWDWDFGNNMISADSNPTTTYTTVNDFDVSLAITNANGCSAGVTTQNYISIGQTPNISFFASDTIICPNEAITFNNFSDPNITNIVWLLNDSVVSTDLNPILTFPDGGMFSIGMAGTINNCRDTITKTGYITVQQTRAEFDADIDCAMPLQVTFSDESSDVVNWQWAFGDPNTTMDTSSLQNPVYSYNILGSYDVVLTITDIFGCTDSTHETINLQNPIAAFGFTHEAECVPAGNTIGIIDTSQFSISCEWIITGNDYLNGTTPASCTPEISFDTAGTYTITQVVFAENGCTDTSSRDICITDVFPYGFLDPNDPNTRDTAILSFTDSLGNTTTGCLVQIDVNTGDTIFVDSLGLTPVDCNAPQQFITGCVPMTVSFMDTSSASPDSIIGWVWNFGDGTTDTVQNPTHTYTTVSNANAFVVTVTAINTFGVGQLDTLSYFVRTTQPSARFVPNRYIACEGQDIIFENRSEGIDLSYSWNFGNGDTRTERSPVYAFSNEGMQQICLTVTDRNGCDSMYCDSILIVNPVAAFTADTTYSACANLTVTYNNSSLNSISYEWDFGNDTIATDTMPSVIYSGTGFYTVTLYAKGESGCIDTLEKINLVRVDGPEVTSFAVNPTDSCVSHKVQFNVQGNNIASMTIEYGNGMDTTLLTNTSATIDTIIEYTYEIDGAYNPVLRVTDSLSCERVFDFNTITTTDPKAVINMTTLGGCAPYFTFPNADSSKYAVSYEWFAEGATTIFGPTLPNPTVRYNNAGFFDTIQLIITDVNGCQDTTYFTDTVTVSDAYAGFTQDVATGCSPLTVNFTDTSSAFPGNITNWNWNFGDGATDTLASPTHIFDGTPNQNYTVTLTTTSTDGCTDVTSIPILPTRPLTFFTADSLACTGQTISFTNQTTGLGLTYLWNFGDGDTSTNINPTHFYTSEDTFSVCLTATDQNGCDSTFCINRIIVGDPVANFTEDKVFIACPPDTIQFTDQSAFAAQWEWNIEGVSPAIRTTQNTAGVYTVPGLYDVQLIITSGSGCRDTMLKENHILVDGPYGILDFTPEEGCVPLQVDFVLALENTVNVFIDKGDGTLPDFVSNPGDTLRYSYTYTSGGNFTPKFFIQDALGCQREVSNGNIFVTEPLAIFDITPDTACLPFSSTVINNSQDVNSFEWDFPGASISNVNLSQPTFTFPDTGYYAIELKVTDVFGCSDSLTQTVVAADVFPSIGASTTAGCRPLVVQFSDLTAVFPDNIVNWQWNFGDGNTSNSANPSHTYLNNGLYTVSLVVTNSLGCSDSITMTDFIEVTFPSVDYTASRTFACTGQQIDFTNASLGDNITYFWNFGNGDMATAQDTSYIYQTEGVYNVCLTVTDKNNCDTTLCQMITIANPVADFSSNVQYVACPPANIQFTDLSTNATAWAWTFGDGGTSMDQNPMHTYTATGFYDVQLIVTSASGCIDTLLKSQYIHVDGPTGSFSFTPKQDCAPFNIDLTGIGASTAQYTWISGNGDTIIHTNNTGMDTHSFIYTSAGTFYPELILEDAAGCQLALTLDSVEVDTLQFNFAASDSLLCETGTINFTHTIQSSSPIDSVLWEFEGAGITSSTATSPNISYNVVGDYDVTLTVYSRHCTKTITKTDFIKIAPIPNNAFVINPSKGCIPTTVNFTDATSIVSGNVTNWAWSFGEGTVDSNQNVTVLYDTVGLFDVQLITVSDFGCSDTLLYTDTITIHPLPVSLFTSDTFACTNQTVNFDNLSAGGNLTYTWDFGDGNISTDFEPTHAYTTEGTFTICLTITDSNTCVHTYCSDVVIANPVANFVADMTYQSCPPSVFQFTDQSINAVAWAWTFGDGDTSILQNPAHTYMTTGFYDVQLIVTGLSGCMDTLLRTQYIEVGGPTGNFSFSTNSGCGPLAVQFDAIGSNIRQYTWRFGNGDSTVNITNQPTDNISYTYTTAGTFYPELTIYDSTGCPLTLMLDSIEVDTLQFDFAASDSLLCEVGTINFTHNIQSSSPIDSVLWEFEGAGITSSTATSPNISYNVVGDYDVTLTVYSRHCTKTITKTDFIKIAPIPNNAFVINPSQGCVPTTVNFTDATSIVSGNVTNWAWSFGEGTVDSNQNVTVLYDTVGLFDVQLITVSDFGCSDTLLYTDTITIHPLPVSLFTSDTFACTNQIVNFANLSTGGNLTYTWDFGDGNMSTVFEPTHAYTTEGTFTVCLTITDSNTCVHTYCSDVVIANPVANFVADTTYKSCPPDSIQFIDQSLNAVAWTWSFGDGDTSILQNPSHTYTTTGFYDVQLIVTGLSGCMDTLLRTQYIEIGGPTGNFSFSTNSGCGPLAVQFDAIGSNIRQYTWRFGNGDSTVNITNQPTDNISYTYTAAGTFFPSLTIYDSTGCPLDLMLDSIEVDTLSFDFTADETLLCETGLVTFTPIIQSSGATDVLSWEFENGTPSNSLDSIPIILYDSLGFYNISLQVESGHCVESVNKFDYIHVAPNPAPNFGTLTSPICSDQTLDFIDISTIVSGNNIGWQWTYDDGDSSLIQSPTHTYADSGSYQVNLAVTSDFGCTVDTTIDVVVNLTPNAESNSPNILCIGESATLTATGGISYLWTSTGAIPCDTCAVIMVSPAVTTDYILQATSAEGCQNIDTVTVEVSIFSVPDLTVSNDTTICTGDVIQLFAGGGNSVLDYEWDDTRVGLSCYSHCSNPFASPTSTTVFPVTLTGPGGCQAMDSITVSVVDQNTDLLGLDRTICLGDSIQFQVPQGSNPVWSPATGLSCVFCANPSIFPNQTTTYAVQVTTAGGCVITDSVTINVVSPSAISAGSDATICTNTSIQLSGFGVGIVSWSPAITLDNPSVLNPTATPTATTDYIITIENDVCILSDTVTITVSDKVDIEGQDYEICEGETVLLSSTGFAQRFEWLPNEEGFLQQSPTIVQPSVSTTYALVGEIDNCANDTAYFNITVNEIPNIDLLDFQSAYIGLGTPLPVNNPNPNYTYTWMPSNGLSCVDCPTPQIVADSSSNGTMITVDVMSSEGCSYTDSVQITVISGCGADIVQLPTAFTPNDDGRNDILYVRGNGIQTIEVFRVYNRWGQLMFEGNDLSDGWDGKYKGQVVPSGVYVYYVVASCPITGEEVIKRGDVMVQD